MYETVRIFISSKQKELEQERVWAKEAVEETGKDLGKNLKPVLVEHKPAPPSITVLEQCLEELKCCNVIICIYYKTISEIVKNEFRWANERGIPIFIFKREPDGRDESDYELRSFLENEVRPPKEESEGRYGIYVYKSFCRENIKDRIKASLKKYYPTWFSFKPVPERYLPSYAWPSKLEKIKAVYVKPHCYSMAEEKLRNNRLLIITGPAHVGKTSMAFYLADSFQKNISRRFLIFPASGDLLEIADLHNSIVLFDDPFGGTRYEPFPGSIVDRFDRLQWLSTKNYIIVTSRRGMVDGVTP